MSDKEKQDLQDKIIKDLESDIKKVENTLETMKEKLEYLKDLAWDRQSKKESSQMYKVLKEDKTHTRVKSSVGDIKVDKDFMDKEIKKHLDNPNLRGMVTTQEMLSFTKVAKNVEAKYDLEHKDYTWGVKANDKNILVYGNREFIKDNEKINRLLTTHSKTEYGDRKIAEMGRQSQFCLHYLKTPIFANPLKTLPQNKPNSLNKEQNTNKNTQKEFSNEQIKAMREQKKKASQNLGLGDSAKSKSVELLI